MASGSRHPHLLGITVLMVEHDMSLVSAVSTACGAELRPPSPWERGRGAVPSEVIRVTRR